MLLYKEVTFTRNKNSPVLWNIRMQVFSLLKHHIDFNISMPDIEQKLSTPDLATHWIIGDEKIYNFSVMGSGSSNKASSTSSSSGVASASLNPDSRRYTSAAPV